MATEAPTGAKESVPTLLPATAQQSEKAKTVVSGDEIAGRLAALRDGLKTLMDMGEILAGSGLYGAKSKQQGAILVLHAFEHRMAISDVGAQFHVMTDKWGRTNMALKSLVVIANFQARGGVVEIKELTDKSAKMHLEAPHVPGKPKRDEVLSEAQVIKMLGGEIDPKSAWAKNPEEMYFLRCAVRGIKKIDPGATMGSPTEADVEDAAGAPPPEVETGPAAPPQPEASRDLSVLRQDQPAEKIEEPARTEVDKTEAAPPPPQPQPEAQSSTTTTENQPTTEKESATPRRQRRLKL